MGGEPKPRFLRIVLRPFFRLRFKSPLLFANEKLKVKQLNPSKKEKNSNKATVILEESCFKEM